MPACLLFNGIISILLSEEDELVSLIKEGGVFPLSYKDRVKVWVEESRSDIEGRV